MEGAEKVRVRLALIGATTAALIAPLGAVPVSAAELPGAPTNVTWSDQSQEEAAGDIYLSWRAPVSDGGEPITAYEIQQTKDGQWIDLHTFRSVSGRLTLEINDIPRGVTYRFRVAAVTAAGRGPWAESGDVRLRTLPSAPRNVAWSVTPAGDLKVSWQKPADTGGPLPPNLEFTLPDLVSYTVWVSPDGQTWIPAASQRANLPLYILSSKYRAGERSLFAVSAMNELGNGPRSEPTTWFEPSEARPETPTNLRMTFRSLPRGKVAASITWMPGDSGGTPQYFKITAYVNGQRVVREKRVDSARFTLGNIPARDFRDRPSKVQVSVRAWNAKFFSTTTANAEAYVP